MKNQELFHKTVNILVQAYLKNTLEHGNCAACAVGNIIAASYGFEVKPNRNFWQHKGRSFYPNWHYAFVTGKPGGAQIVNKGSLKLIYGEIAYTGYKWFELAKIEHAFESAPGYYPKGDDPKSIEKAYKDEEWMFNGLMAVIDCLCEIHEMNDEAKQEAKALFVR